MRKALSRKDHALDYGASWSTLFLAPVVGALTGWVGVLLVLGVTEAHVRCPVFESMLNLYAIRDVPWNELEIPREAMALAVVFGFCATFLSASWKRWKAAKTGVERAPTERERCAGVTGSVCSKLDV